MNTYGIIVSGRSIPSGNVELVLSLEIKEVDFESTVFLVRFGK